MEILSHITPLELPIGTVLYLTGVLSGLVLAWLWGRLRQAARP